MSNLKTIREKAGITQVVLARLIGLTQSAIAHYESGRRTPPLEECRRIVVALNTSGADVTLDDVFPPASSDQSAA